MAEAQRAAVEVRAQAALMVEAIEDQAMEAVEKAQAEAERAKAEAERLRSELEAASRGE